MFVIPVSATGIGIFMWFILGGIFPNAVEKIFNIIGYVFFGSVIGIPALLIVFLILCAKYEDMTGRPLKWVRRFAGEREIRQKLN